LKKSITVFKRIIFLNILIFSAILSLAQNNTDAFLLDQKSHGITDWLEDTLGNHRVIVDVIGKSDVIWAHIPWRRSDLEPEKKNIFIFDAKTGKQIDNRIIINCNREFGDIVFQPVTSPGKYYIYYFPYRPEGMYYWGDIKYIEPKTLADAEWIKKNRLDPGSIKKGIYKKFQTAKIYRFEARGDVNNFYPMEIIATKTETEKLLKKYKNSEFLIFPEDRRFPVKMTDDLPQRWIEKGPSEMYSAEVMRGEAFSFQLGLFAITKDIINLKIELSDLADQTGKHLIPVDSISCINLWGTDWKGNHFDKIFDIQKDKIRPLWIEIMLPKDINPGDYSGNIKLLSEGTKPVNVKVQLKVKEEISQDRGDSEPWKHSRLRWLNSTIALDDEIVKPFIPMIRNENILSCLGRKVSLNNEGLPENIQSYFTPEMTNISDKPREMLTSPISFKIINSENREIVINSKGNEIIKENQGIISWKTSKLDENFTIDQSAGMEFDGCLEYQVVVTAKNDVNVNDIFLNIPFRSDVAKFAMGMNIKGGYRPDNIDWKWDVNRHQDAVWIGDVNAGLQLKLKGENYQRPLVNLHYKHKKIKMPPAWFNDGKGGVKMYQQDSNTVILKAYSGKRSIKAGEKLCFYFSLLVTPFKTLDTKSQWSQRYFHFPNRRLYPIDSIKMTGANVVNVHHANAANPYLNYPFLTADKMKSYVDEAHKNNLRLKIYYTTREISDHVVESAAWRSLGEEIYAYGPGGGNATLREHYYSNYIPAWYEGNWKDACIINSGMSRLHNYYLEGLDWLTKNIGIDGLYLDDVAFDRVLMKRTRKILDRNRPNALIDLHSWNHYNELAGFANNANLYMEHMPYINRLWFGELFDYKNTSPDYWMVEISGIPYGLMGEMLQDGGNQWRGMVYGMTNRLPWLGDPKAIWKLWDDFGIQESEMFGYWSPNCPVKTDNKDILATAYVRKDRVLISIASWAKEPVKCKMTIDFKTLGFNPAEMILEAPEILKFQSAAKFGINDLIEVQPEKGWLLVLKKK
jgi:hypothetical protein